MKTEFHLASRTRRGHLVGLAGSFAFAMAALLAPASSAYAQSEPDVTTETFCGTGEGTPIVCGVVWDDTNGNGIQDPGEPPRENVTVTYVNNNDPNDTNTTTTGTDGTYGFDGSALPPGTYTVYINTSQAEVPPGTEVSPANQGGDDTVDSDGHDDGHRPDLRHRQRRRLLLAPGLRLRPAYARKPR